MALSVILYYSLFFRVLSSIEETSLTLGTAFDQVGTLIMLVFLSIFQIAICHELVHKQHKIFFVLGSLYGSTLFGMHFLYDHIHGHHRTVGSPCDAGTARNESPTTSSSGGQFPPYGSMSTTTRKNKEKAFC